MKKQITLKHPIFVKGEGLPKDGVCLFNAGETIEVYSKNGAEWFTDTTYKKKVISVAISSSITK